MKKRGQFWYTDYLIGLLVFMIIGFLFVRTVVDISSNNALLEDLVEEGITISNSLTSEGYLHDEWGDDPPKGRIGFVNGGKVNDTSYVLFTSLVSDPDDYEISKYLMGIKYDYVTYFEDSEGVLIPGSIIGKYSVLESIDEADAVVKFVRFVWYDDDNDGKGRIVRLVVEVWK
ncbi:MAG: hypothetical protein KJ674_01205 [Nanoarchaeota archaeon]|nr:hypothetical protein [Nanoarchaeota archaeon]